MKAFGLLGITVCILAMAGKYAVALVPQSAPIVIALLDPGMLWPALLAPAVLFFVAWRQRLVPTVTSWIMLAVCAGLAYLLLSGRLLVSPYLIAISGYAATLFMEGLLEDRPVYRAAPDTDRPAMPDVAAPQRVGGARRG